MPLMIESHGTESKVTWRGGRVTRTAGVLVTEAAGTRILMNPATWLYSELNGPASAIWDLLAEPMDVDALVAALLTQYAVDPATCRGDVQRCLAEFGAAGLIEATGDAKGP
jgi:hypothetical protein